MRSDRVTVTKDERCRNPAWANIRGWPLNCDVLPLNIKGASRFLRKWRQASAGTGTARTGPADDASAAGGYCCRCAGRAAFSAARAVAVGGPLVVLDRGGRGQQQRPRRDPGGDGRPGCAFRMAVLVDGQVGLTADDGQAQDPGGRLVVLVVSGALGADGDVPDHAVIVGQARLAARGGSGMTAPHLPPGFSGRASVRAVYASRLLGRATRAGGFAFVPAPPLQARAILVHLPPK